MTSQARSQSETSSHPAGDSQAAGLLAPLITPAGATLYPALFSFDSLVHPVHQGPMMPIVQQPRVRTGTWGSGSWTPQAQAAWDQARNAAQVAPRVIRGSMLDGLDLAGHMMHVFTLEFMGRVRRNAWGGSFIPDVYDLLTAGNRLLGENVMLFLHAHLDNGPGRPPQVEVWMSRSMWPRQYNEVGMGLAGIFQDVIARGLTQEIDAYLSGKREQHTNNPVVPPTPLPSFDPRVYFNAPNGTGRVSASYPGNPPPPSGGGASQPPSSQPRRTSTSYPNITTAGALVFGGASGSGTTRHAGTPGGPSRTMTSGYIPLTGGMGTPLASGRPRTPCPPASPTPGGVVSGGFSTDTGVASPTSTPSGARNSSSRFSLSLRANPGLVNSPRELWTRPGGLVPPSLPENVRAVLDTWADKIMIADSIMPSLVGELENIYQWDPSRTWHTRVAAVVEHLLGVGFDRFEAFVEDIVNIMKDTRLGAML